MAVVTEIHTVLSLPGCKCQMHPVLFWGFSPYSSSYKEAMSVQVHGKGSDLVFVPKTFLFDPIRSSQLLVKPGVGWNSLEALLWDH